LDEKNKNNNEINNTFNLVQKLKQRLALKTIKLEKAKKNNSELNEFNIKIAGDKKNKLAQNANDL
jgi:hypothetical protein